VSAIQLFSLSNESGM